MTTNAVVPVCPFCGATEAIPAVAEESGEPSPAVAITAGLTIAAVAAIAVTALLLSGWIAWLLTALLLFALWQKKQSHRESAAVTGPCRWYCPECERIFPV